MSLDDISDPEAFSSYMAEVNARLRDDGVPIESRPIRAWMRVCDELRVASPLGGELSDRINIWFKKLYAERLLADPCLGRMLIDIRGDAYAARFPMIFGTLNYNPLELIEHVTRGLFEGMSHPECTRIAETIEAGFLAFLTMMQKRVPRELIADLDVAVDQILGRSTVPGGSKWSSQQAVEKLLNAFVTSRGGNPKAARKRGQNLHALVPLAQLAESLGLGAVDRNRLAAIDCPADARYPGRLSISVTDAVNANQAAVLVCGQVANHW